MRYWEKDYFQPNLDTKLHLETNGWKPSQRATPKDSWDDGISIHEWLIFMGPSIQWDVKLQVLSILDLRSSSFKVFNLELQASKKS